MTAAKTAGCWSCHAKWGLPSGANELDADYTVNTPEELMKFFLQENMLASVDLKLLPSLERWSSMIQYQKILERSAFSS